MRDVDIRLELKNTLLKKHYTCKDTKVVNELPVGYGDAIIDIAVINGSLHGYEIKSEYDTLNRLPRQIASYSKTFDFVTIVTAAKHLNHLIPILPNWCGIVLVNNNKKRGLSKYRPSKKNPSIDNFSVAQLLWKDELLDTLSTLGFKGIKSKSKPMLWALLANSITQKELSNIVREKMKIRPNWKPDRQPFENGDYFPLCAKL